MNVSVGDRLECLVSHRRGTVTDLDWAGSQVLLRFDDGDAQWRYDYDQLRKLSLLELVAEAAQ